MGKNNNLQNLFIETYKLLESYLAKAGTTVFDYENTLDTSDQKKMQLCRITRNFLQHENDMFTAPTQQMVDFLKDHVEITGNRFTKVSDKMTKTRPLTEDVKVKEAVSSLSDKKNIIPVVDDTRHLTGFFTPGTVVKAVNNNTLNKKISQVKDILDSVNTVKIVPPDMLMDDITAGEIYVVTTDGTIEGMYKGILSV